jgi:hypothetical protein
MSHCIADSNIYVTSALECGVVIACSFRWMCHCLKQLSLVNIFQGRLLFVHIVSFGMLEAETGKIVIVLVHLICGQPCVRSYGVRRNQMIFAGFLLAAMPAQAVAMYFTMLQPWSSLRSEACRDTSCYSICRGSGYSSLRLWTHQCKICTNAYIVTFKWKIARA